MPKGQTVTYDRLNTGNIVVKGTLIVNELLTAAHIQGGGTIEAGEIQCDTIEANIVRANIVTARKIIGKKLFVRDCRATDAVMATDFIEANRLITQSLHISLSSISECDAQEIMVLPQRNRSLLRMLIASKIRCIWCSLLHHRVNEDELSADDETDKAEEEPLKEPPANSSYDRTLVSAIMEYLDDNGYLIGAERRSNEEAYDEVA